MELNCIMVLTETKLRFERRHEVAVASFLIVSDVASAVKKGRR